MELNCLLKPCACRKHSDSKLSGNFKIHRSLLRFQFCISFQDRSGSLFSSGCVCLCDLVIAFITSRIVFVKLLLSWCVVYVHSLNEHLCSFPTLLHCKVRQIKLCKEKKCQQLVVKALLAFYLISMVICTKQRFSSQAINYSILLAWWKTSSSPSCTEYGLYCFLLPSKHLHM